MMVAVNEQGSSELRSLELALMEAEAEAEVTAEAGDLVGWLIAIEKIERLERAIASQTT
jgi:hypothetical protein